jgi:hypothetical protein
VADEEVTVSYRASGDPDAPLWFDVVDPGGTRSRTT